MNLIGDRAAPPKAIAPFKLILSFTLRAALIEFAIALQHDY
ncbi:hypothetical protein [Gloeocapsa sp. PCC 73106]|nr:hypothetical protein [Gloeocapsa sp. PCC 73106]